MVWLLWLLAMCLIFFMDQLIFIHGLHFLPRNLIFFHLHHLIPCQFIPNSINPISTPPVLAPLSTCSFCTTLYIFTTNSWCAMFLMRDMCLTQHGERYVSTRRGGYHQFLVHCSGRSEDERTWASALEFCQLTPDPF